MVPVSGSGIMNVFDEMRMPMAMFNPVVYFRQVKSEVKKVTWPTRKETTVSAIAVFVMVLISSVFLFFADQVIAFIVRMILSIGG
jgi:preprotein translocase subunit SecE